MQNKIGKYPDTVPVALPFPFGIIGVPDIYTNLTITQSMLLYLVQNFSGMRHPVFCQAQHMQQLRMKCSQTVVCISKQKTGEKIIDETRTRENKLP
jgi:hypothetical protein